MHNLAMLAGRSALVVKKFEINEEGPLYVHIVARKAGLVSWLLTRMGIDATTVFELYDDRIEFSEGSLSGNIQTIMPLSALSIASCGFTKPFFLIAMAIVCLILAIPTLGLTLIFSIVFFIFYFLKKSILIQIVSNSSWPATICFKRSVIEGVRVDFEMAQKVTRLVNRLVLQQTVK